MEQCGRELYIFKKLVQKAKNAKAKAVLQPCSYVRKIDKYCYWDNWPEFEKVNG